MSICKVMLVDDEPDIRTIGRISLERVGGWTAVLCAGGTEAIAAASAERPDLILLDGMMPDLDGAATLAALRSNPDTAAIPIIFLTARAQKHDVDRYLALGAAGVIVKPFDPMTLPDQIRRLVESA